MPHAGPRCLRRRAALLGAMLLSACGGNAATPAPAQTATPRPSATPQPSSPYTSVSPPSARFGAALAYDVASRRLILFGGESTGQGGPHDDTWAWDGTRWHQLRPAHSPPALTGAALVADPGGKGLLLISGVGALDGNDFPQQEGMWRFANGDWTRVTDNPLQDAQVNVAVDAAHHQVLLDGAGDTGAGAVQPPPTFVAGAYVWDGTTWTKAASSLSGADTVMGSHCAGIAFDPLSGHVIEFGGSQQAALGDTLGWNGRTWKTLLSQPQPDPAMPPPGCAAAVFYPPQNHVILLAGTADVANLMTTWMWNGAAWERLRGTQPPAFATLPTLAWDPDTNGIVSFGGVPARTDGTTAPPTDEMFIWQGSGWSNIPGGGSGG